MALETRVPANREALRDWPRAAACGIVLPPRRWSRSLGAQCGKPTDDWQQLELLCGWLKTMGGVRPRAPRGPSLLQPALFPYAEAL